MRRLPTRDALPIVTALLALLLAGCSEDGGGGGPDHDPAARTVVIDGFSYSPATITVQQGDTVVFRNTHNQAHTATMDSGERDTGNIAPGGEARFTVPTPGRLGYHCKVHPTMTGTLNVVEA